MTHTTLFKKQSAFALSLILIAILGISAGAFTSRLVQDNHLSRIRVLEKQSSRNEPLAITEVLMANKPIKFSDKLDSDDDWLKNISLKVKNISDKPIVHIEIDLNFPETKVTGNLMSYRIQLGQSPGLHLPNQQPLLLQPGETIDIPLLANYDRIKRFIEHRHQMADIHNGVIQIRFVVYSDMTGWAMGGAIRQDPNKPTRFIPDETPSSN